MSYVSDQAERHIAILRRVRAKFEHDGEIGSAYTERERTLSMRFFDDTIAAIESGADPLRALVGRSDVRLKDSGAEKQESDDQPW